MLSDPEMEIAYQKTVPIISSVHRSNPEHVQNVCIGTQHNI